MVGSYNEQTELLFDFEEIMKEGNLSEEQNRVEFLKLRCFHEKILQMLVDVLIFKFRRFQGKKNEISYN